MSEDDFFSGRPLARRKALRRLPPATTEDEPAAAAAATVAPARPPAPPLDERAAPRAPPTAPRPAPRADAAPHSAPSAPSAPSTQPSRAPRVHRPHMVDVGAKPVVHREATAEGFLRLLPRTLEALRLGTGPKGDPFPAAQVAGVLAAKNTPQIIPFCHPLPLTGVDVDLQREAGGVRCRATVRTDGKTGVEMEALAAVTAALLTVWDMTKALEKDDQGQYPGTRLEDVRVVSKLKGEPSA